MNITHSVFMLYLSFMSMGVHAQTPVSYSYDASGNHVKREIVLAKSQLAPQEYSEVAADYAIKITTNEDGNAIHVESQELKDKNCLINVCTVNGEHVCTASLRDGMATIDMSSQKSGVYVMNISVDGTWHSWKIMKR